MALQNPTLHQRFDETSLLTRLQNAYGQKMVLYLLRQGQRQSFREIA
jgi:hypothetical protein